MDLPTLIFFSVSCYYSNDHRAIKYRGQASAKPRVALKPNGWGKVRSRTPSAEVFDSLYFCALNAQSSSLIFPDRWSQYTIFALKTGLQMRRCLRTIIHYRDFTATGPPTRATGNGDKNRGLASNGTRPSRNSSFTQVI
jgi:hypothetical protein